MNLNADLAVALEGLGLSMPEAGEGTPIQLAVPGTSSADLLDLGTSLHTNRDGRFFALQTPVGGFDESADAASVVLMLATESMQTFRYRGAGVSVTVEQDVILAIHHWVLPAISPADFRELVLQHGEGAASLIERVHALSAALPGVLSRLS